MKIKKEDLQKFKDILKDFKLPENYKDQKAKLFFPIEASETVEDRDTGLILLEVKKEGFAKLVQPGLTLIPGKSERHFPAQAVVAYATTEYKVPFNFKEHIKLMNLKSISEDNVDFINDHECYLLANQQILIEFDL
jgi:hypothetical protein